MKFILQRVLDTDTQNGIKDEVDVADSLWGVKTFRTDHEGSAHKEVVDILLRGPDLDGDDPFNDLYCEDYTTMHSFPRIKSTINDLTISLKMFNVGRIILTQLAPNGVIYPHVDEGDVPDYYRRFHYVIDDGGDGNLFIIGNSTQQMRTGQLWEVDVKQKHAVLNMGERDRVHMIVDLH